MMTEKGLHELMVTYLSWICLEQNEYHGSTTVQPSTDPMPK